MADEPIVTKEDLDRMKQLTAEISAFRKSLVPMHEEVNKELSSLVSAPHIIKIMQFEGSQKFVSTGVKLGDMFFDVTFKVSAPRKS